jgi:hypothetical protein
MQEEIMKASYSIPAALGFILASTAVMASQSTSQNENGLTSQTVRKTCDCVRKHASGFPYIEQRITECKTYKDAQGKVKSVDCMNCYAICTDKPAS